jgi:hypothetical protein
MFCLFFLLFSAINAETVLNSTISKARSNVWNTGSLEPCYDGGVFGTGSGSGSGSGGLFGECRARIILFCASLAFFFFFSLQPCLSFLFYKNGYFFTVLAPAGVKKKLSFAVFFGVCADFLCVRVPLFLFFLFWRRG